MIRFPISSEEVVPILSSLLSTFFAFLGLKDKGLLLGRGDGGRGQVVLQVGVMVGRGRGVEQERRARAKHAHSLRDLLSAARHSEVLKEEKSDSSLLHYLG